MSSETQTQQASSIYQQLKDAGVPLDSHESDLYAKLTPQSQVIVDAYKLNQRRSVYVFRSELDGALWYEIPFAFEPWWDAQTGEGRTR